MISAISIATLCLRFSSHYITSAVFVWRICGTRKRTVLRSVRSKNEIRSARYVYIYGYMHIKSIGSASPAAGRHVPVPLIAIHVSRRFPTQFLPATRRGTLLRCLCRPPRPVRECPPAGPVRTNFSRPTRRALTHAARIRTQSRTY